MATRDVFSQEELEQLRGFPEIDRAELIRYFTLTPADEAFVRQFQGQGNVLGAAVQLCTLPWLGFVPDDVPSASAAAVARLLERLGIPVGELRSYGAREQTRTEHLRQVAGYAGWRSMDGLEWKQVADAVVPAGVRVSGVGAGDRPGVVYLLTRLAGRRRGSRCAGSCCGCSRPSRRKASTHTTPRTRSGFRSAQCHARMPP